MTITKFGHSCLLIESDNAKIMVDPGSFAKDHLDIEGIHAILITHEHGDHCDIPSVQSLVATNSDAQIYTNSAVVALLEKEGIVAQVVKDGESINIQGVEVLVHDVPHEHIYEGIIPPANTGFLIAGRFYYGGDNVSTMPPQPVEILALPTTAPWLKMNEAIDFAKEVKPKVCFPVHDGHLGYPGGFHKHPERFVGEVGIEYVVIEHAVPKEF
jgi:L-ascorbate metabolism protein UlaG (beta-lactamase superfamily)